LRQRLAELKDHHPQVVEDVRGEGLMIGLKLKTTNTEFAAAARAERLLTIPAGDNVVRLLPPLIISEDEVAEGVRRLGAACRRVEQELAATRKGVAE
jgi:acetylornithine/N-succinyldiaminopimelate aminotransferase